MSDNPEFSETFDISRFIQDEPFEQIISRFETGRTPDKIPKHKNKVLTVEEFKEETKETKPQSREQLIKHLEKLEKEIEFEHTN